MTSGQKSFPVAPMFEFSKHGQNDSISEIILSPFADDMTLVNPFTRKPLITPNITAINTGPQPGKPSMGAY